MKIGGMLAGEFLLEISMASLLLGWGVNLLMRHHSFNSRNAKNPVKFDAVLREYDAFFLSIFMFWGYA